MWFVYAGITLIACKLLDVGVYADFLKPLSNLSWWWIALVFVIAFIYFEFIEPIFGLDKRKAIKESEFDQERLARVKKNLQIQRPITQRRK